MYFKEMLMVKNIYGIRNIYRSCAKQHPADQSMHPLESVFSHRIHLSKESKRHPTPLRNHSHGYSAYFILKCLFFIVKVFKRDKGQGIGDKARLAASS